MFDHFHIDLFITKRLWLMHSSNALFVKRYGKIWFVAEQWTWQLDKWLPTHRFKDISPIYREKKKSWFHFAGPHYRNLSKRRNSWAIYGSLLLFWLKTESMMYGAQWEQKVLINWRIILPESRQYFLQGRSDVWSNNTCVLFTQVRPDSRGMEKSQGWTTTLSPLKSFSPWRSPELS